MVNTVDALRYLIAFVVVAYAIAALFAMNNTPPKWFKKTSDFFDGCGTRLLVGSIGVFCAFAFVAHHANAETMPQCQLSQRQRDAISEASTHYQVSPDILVAMAMVESSCHQEAVGAAGEIGLLQIMPREKGYWFRDRPTRAELRDEYVNIVTAAWILNSNYNRYCKKFNNYDRVWCSVGVYNEGTMAFWTGRLGKQGQGYVNKVKSFMPFAAGLNIVESK